jgi:hypothetical protein
VVPGQVLTSRRHTCKLYPICVPETLPQSAKQGPLQCSRRTPKPCAVMRPYQNLLPSPRQHLLPSQPITHHRSRSGNGRPTISGFTSNILNTPSTKHEQHLEVLTNSRRVPVTPLCAKRNYVSRCSRLFLFCAKRCVQKERCERGGCTGMTAADAMALVRGLKCDSSSDDESGAQDKIVSLKTHN